MSTVELATVCQALGLSKTKAEIAQLMAECDLDGSGVIEFAELAKALEVTPGFGSSEMKRIVRGQKLRREQLQKAFDELDVDGSGAISTAEISRLLHALNLEKTTEEVLQLVATVDPDGSGQIDFEVGGAAPPACSHSETMVPCTMRYHTRCKAQLTMPACPGPMHTFFHDDYCLARPILPQEFAVAMASDGEDNAFKRLIKRSSTVARVASRVGQKDASPEQYNLPLAIFTGVVSFPFLALFKLSRPVLSKEKLRALMDTLNPPPLAECVVVARKAAHTLAGIELKWSSRRDGLGSDAPCVVFIESTSPLAGLLQVGDQLLAINDKVPGSCEEAAALIVEKRLLRFAVLRVDRSWGSSSGSLDATLA